MTPTLPPTAPTETATPRHEQIYGKPRGRAWLYRFLALMGCGLLVAVWFAPGLMATSSLRHRIPKLLLPKYPGAIEIGSASLDWLSPVVIRNLRFEDANGHTLLDISEISTSEPLWRLVTRRSNIGVLKIDKPNLAVSLRSGGSDLEDMLKILLSGPVMSRPPDFELEVIDATVSLDHKLASLHSTVEPVSMILTCRRGIIEEFELTVGQVPSPTEPSLTPPTDWLAFRYGSQPTQDGVAMTPGSKHLRFKAQGWKLDKLLPALVRFEPHGELSGEIDADARSQIDFAVTEAPWTEREWSWDGRITAKGINIAGISILNRDRITTASTSLAGRIAVQRGRLSMDRLQFKTEVAELTATGDIPLQAFSSTSPAVAGSSILEEQDYRIQGHLDLQKLAALLPNTLRVREGTQITGGRLDVNVMSEDKDKSARHWTVEATIDGLAGTNNGRPVSWNVPLRMNLQAHRMQNVVTVDQVICKSDFLNLTGSGTLTDAKFEATCDLGRLEASLQQLFNFGLQKLAGRMQANGRIQRTAEDRISLESVVQLDNFDWSSSNKDLWQEPHLVFSIQATGQTEDNVKLKQIDSAELKLVSGTDSLTTNLTQPVDLEAKSATWPIKASLSGDLRAWQNRLRPLVGSTNWQCSGQATLEAIISKTPKQTEISKLTGSVTSLEVRNPDWWIKEPKLTLDAAGTWSVDQREWSSPQTTLSGTSLSCRIDNLRIALKPDGSLDRVSGDAGYRADLDKVSRWKVPAAYYFAGTLEGKAILSEHDSVISFETETTITKLLAADLETLPNQQLQWVALWREPQLQVVGKGSYDTTTDGLDVESASLHADGLGLSLSGKMDQLRTTQRVDVKGQLDYDWDLVSKRLGDSLRKSIQLTGKETRPFNLKGNLASLTATPVSGVIQPSDVVGEAGIGWQSAVFQGLPMGSAEISARFDQGICQFTPIDTTLANGRLHLTPQLRFDRNPSILVLSAEKVLDQVELSPQLCSSWIKFVAPMLADATQVNGKCSLDLAGGALPLSAPKTGELSGVLTVHQAQVRPGASATQVLSMMGQIQSILQKRPAGNLLGDQVLIEMPEQPVSFKLANGRVTNDGVTFVIRGASIRSSGSVGLIDETLDIVLQIPIRDEWVPDKRLLQGLKGQSLQIPVRGTLSQPQIDGRVIGDLAAKMGGAALNGVLDGAINDLFNKKLNKILPGQD